MRNKEICMQDVLPFDKFRYRELALNLMVKLSEWKYHTYRTDVIKNSSNSKTYNFLKIILHITLATYNDVVVRSIM